MSLMTVKKIVEILFFYGNVEMVGRCRDKTVLSLFEHLRGFVLHFCLNFFASLIKFIEDAKNYDTIKEKCLEYFAEENDPRKLSFNYCKHTPRSINYGLIEEMGPVVQNGWLRNYCEIQII